MLLLKSLRLSERSEQHDFEFVRTWLDRFLDLESTGNELGGDLADENVVQAHCADRIDRFQDERDVLSVEHRLIDVETRTPCPVGSTDERLRLFAPGNVGIGNHARRNQGIVHTTRNARRDRARITRSNRPRRSSQGDRLHSTRPSSCSSAT